ncbi:unnamed protein product [Auanema sp. JU1783]|nr:unnamed protein product [Auanema sp. JU1783]
MTTFRLGPLHNIPANRRTPYVQADGIVTPHGYLRIVEMVLGIVAVILISCWHLDLDYTCRHENQTIYGYQDSITSFTLTGVQLHDCDGSYRTLWHHNDNAGKRLIFFNLISSIELGLSSVIVIIYLLFWGQYCRNEIFPLLYIATSTMMTIVFLICTVIWWTAITDIITATSKDYIENLLTENAGFWDQNSENMILYVNCNHWMLIVSGMFPFCAFVLNLVSSGFLFGRK